MAVMAPGPMLARLTRPADLALVAVRLPSRLGQRLRPRLGMDAHGGAERALMSEMNSVGASDDCHLALIPSKKA